MCPSNKSRHSVCNSYVDRRSYPGAQVGVGTSLDLKFRGFSLVTKSAADDAAALRVRGCGRGRDGPEAGIGDYRALRR